ncbi:ABC transporter permease [Deinococcus marmoris]|uniref:Peptide ABC transporter, permease protein n=1 Tax=Deinococcus marmoris TaxID=249408 RepID=A0A1U7NVL0_9DEIO|nr:ABC transporter permease [Deinococcus marmoris]OLV16955.1 peptide ABC transporter, permease protein [Deinococcus marmoris]
MTYVVQRLIQAVLVTFILSLTTFGLLYGVKDPARILAGPDATAQDIVRLRQTLGLNEPLPVQYGKWLGRATTGDFGRSLFTDEPVFDVIRPRIRYTLQLTFSALVLALTLGLFLGIQASLRRGSWIDVVANMLATAGQAVPNFWLGLMLIILFAVQLRWLPVAGSGGWKHLVLPTLTLASGLLPVIMRLTRSSMLDVLSQDYVRTARAKGVSERQVTVKHALRNALNPIITVVGLQVGALLGGAVVTESVFAWPGLGQLAVQSITQGDVPIVQGIVLLTALSVVIFNLMSDLLIGLVDPRVRYG